MPTIASSIACFRRCRRRAVTVAATVTPTADASRAPVPIERRAVFAAPGPFRVIWPFFRRLPPQRLDGNWTLDSPPPPCVPPLTSVADGNSVER